jgi:hypothetical protein
MSELQRARPDAVLVPERYKRGARSVHRVDSILKIAEPLLGVVLGRGERAYIRRQEGVQVGMPKENIVCFVVRSLADTVNYAKHDHKNRRGCRYRWEHLGEFALGYLLDPEDREIQC